MQGNDLETGIVAAGAGMVAVAAATVAPKAVEQGKTKFNPIS